MDIFLDNFYFIWINSLLALVAVLFGWLMSKADSIFAKAWTGFVWIVFLPNTFYILTDIVHLVEQWPNVSNLFRVILIIQYSIFSIFGISAFIMAVYFFQKLLGRKPSTFVLICILNFLVGFGVILGAIQRTNSWHIFTNPLRVINDIAAIISSQEVLMLSAGFGILANLIYFFTLQATIKWNKKSFKN